MTVTVDLLNSNALNLLKDLESINVIRLISPITGEDVDHTLAAGEPCPLCTIYHEPNEETIAALEECDAMVRGEVPVKWFNSAEEMLADLYTDDEDN